MARTRAPVATETPHWVIDLSTPASSRGKPAQNFADPPGYAAGGGSKVSLYSPSVFCLSRVLINSKNHRKL